VRSVAQRLGLALTSVVITVAGTNGKGSTCAMLEAILLEEGYRVGTYTSPHLVDFVERARVNGVPAEPSVLAGHFEAVEAARGDTRLTYFEFSTLAILHLFQESALDVAILEVGLGGRLDAVNIVDADCSIVTSVDIDHAEWLGTTREEIGLEKAHVFRPGRPAICSDPVPPRSLVDHAQSIGADLWLFGRDYNYSGDRQQWSWAGRTGRRNSMAYPALRGANQLLNASGALAALESLRSRLPVTQQAVRKGFAVVTLPGRFEVLPGQPSVILDVAHNPHAAAHLAVNLDRMGHFKRTWAVFGILGDKDVDGVIAALKDRVDHWLVAGLPGPRAADPEKIAERLRAAGVREHAPDSSITTCPSPSDGLVAAQKKAGGNDRILVFGSFLTVADVLRTQAAARRSSRHGQAQR
jgi:dihydrofolate synthase/folylpolyglutamate synthase